MPRRRTGRLSRGPTIGGSLELRMAGAEALRDVAKDVRRVGDKSIRRELNRALRAATKPAIAETRQYARENLPKRGHLNERVARSKFRTKIRTGANPSVRVTATGMDARLDTQGRDRHPVFGNRKVWVQQKVKPGWFDVPMRRGARHVREELVDSIDRIANELEGR